jgi:hypothetical protein
MVALLATLLFIPEAPNGPSPVVPLLLLAFVICYAFFRGGAVSWVRSNLLHIPDAGEDQSAEKD